MATARTVTGVNKRTKKPAPTDVLTEERINEVRAQLIESDGEPMDTPWHRDELSLLMESIKWHRRPRTDYFAGGNMFLYYSMKQSKTLEYKGPDFFLVNNIDGKRERSVWWVFEEDARFPDVIIELLSPTTEKVDRTTKKSLYETRFRTPEYFLYDPDKKKLDGWRLINSSYQPIQPNDRGWMWSEQLDLWLGTWEGSYLESDQTWLRFYDKNSKLVPIRAEAREQQLKRANRRAEKEKERAEQEQQRAEQEKQRAELEQQRAEQEMQRAEQEKQRADELQSELERVKALLAKKSGHR